MYYKVYYDGSYSYISKTEDEPNGDDVFYTLKEAKTDLLYQLTQAKKGIQQAINKIRSITQLELDDEGID